MKRSHQVLLSVLSVALLGLLGRAHLDRSGDEAILETDITEEGQTLFIG